MTITALLTGGEEEGSVAAKESRQRGIVLT